MAALTKTQSKTKSVTDIKLAVATAFLGFATLAAAAAGGVTSSTCTVDSFVGPTVVEVYPGAEKPTYVALCKGEQVTVLTEGKNTDPDFGVRGYSAKGLVLKKLGSGVVEPIQESFSVKQEMSFVLQAPGIEYIGYYRGIHPKTGQAMFYLKAVETVPVLESALQIVSHFIPNSELVEGSDVLIGSYILNSTGNEGVCLRDFTLGFQGNFDVLASLHNARVKVTGVGEIANFEPEAKNNMSVNVCLDPESVHTLTVLADVSSLNGFLALQTSIDAYSYEGVDSSTFVTVDQVVPGTVFTYENFDSVDESFWADMSVSTYELDTKTLVNGTQAIGQYVLSSTGMSDVCVNEISATLSGNVEIGELVLVADNGEKLSTIDGPEELGTFDAVFPVDFCMDPKSTRGIEIQTLVTGVTQSFNYYLASTFDSVTFEKIGSEDVQTKTFDLAPQLLVNN